LTLLAIFVAVVFWILARIEAQVNSRLESCLQAVQAIGIKTLADSNYEVFSNTMAGRITLGLPFRSPLFVDKTTHREYAVLTVGSPIRNRKGDVIAALLLRLDPRRDFTRVAGLGHLDTTGETYAFDRYGRLLTQSRFENQLRQIGLIPPDADSILYLEIRDPGGNTTEGFKPAIPRHQQPFTRSVQSAIQGDSGIDMKGSTIGVFQSSERGSAICSSTWG
jgi:hypothetical protein